MTVKPVVVQYYNNDYILPVYKYTRKRETLGIEHNESINERIVCSRQPTSVCHNSVFIVDLNDIRADDNGSWNRTGFPITYISVHKNSSGHQIIQKRSKFGNSSHHYKIIRVYYKHSSSPDFRKIITYSRRYIQHALYLNIFIYIIKGKYKNMHLSNIYLKIMNELKPHGNSKGKMPYRHTKSSTLKKIKQGVKPRHVIDNISTSMGGVMNAVAFHVIGSKHIMLRRALFLAEMMRICKQVLMKYM